MYKEEDLVRIAKRENNTKRKYLVVNRLQGKHIPVSPKNAFEMFDALAELVKEAYSGEQLLLVGFAETATAIGGGVGCKTGYLLYADHTGRNRGSQLFVFLGDP